MRKHSCYCKGSTRVIAEEAPVSLQRKHSCYCKGSTCVIAEKAFVLLQRKSVLRKKTGKTKKLIAVNEKIQYDNK